MDEYISKDRVLCLIYATHSADGFKTEEDYLWLQEAVIDAATANVLPVKLILQIVQGRLNGVNYTMSEAIKSNDTNTAYKMKGANDICNEILADLKALTAKDGDTNG